MSARGARGDCPRGGSPGPAAVPDSDPGVFLVWTSKTVGSPGVLSGPVRRGRRSITVPTALAPRTRRVRQTHRLRPGQPLRRGRRRARPDHRRRLGRVAFAHRRRPRRHQRASAGHDDGPGTQPRRGRAGRHVPGRVGHERRAPRRRKSAPSPSSGCPSSPSCSRRAPTSIGRASRSGSAW